MKKRKGFTAVIGFDRAMRLYVGVVPGLASANVAAPTMEEVERELKKIVAMYQKAEKSGDRPLPDYVGLRTVTLH